jgi:hypothetical protein
LDSKDILKKDRNVGLAWNLFALDSKDILKKDRNVGLV